MSDATVFVVDDDAAIRDALSLLISLRGLRTQVFESAGHFLDTYRSEWRGCLLADLQMPGMSGLELQAELKARGIALPVIVLTAHGDVAAARAALKNGAVDFLEKPVDDTVLMDVLGNAIRLDADQHTAAHARAAATERLGRLTPRERDVLRLLAQGCQLREIAQQLEISPRTVEVYKARMMEKLGCRTLADVVRAGAALGP
ncbi:MAG TPA: response regulator [Steroidobacteraceae bacterium]|nr:response regulator transcription factor [Steroidobacteraceae bacterium]HQW08125.1 response regulator [Steroidobacteraceae bacterium]HQX79097.1 response regulator [Steroidobacteraceae bacterium]HQZ80314.1 response regulator [Steroidobacteraceae bacterium]